MPSSAFATGTILNGAYTLVDPIGGSATQVYRARRANDGELFVARRLPAPSAADLARVRARLEAASQIRHPSVAAIEAFGLEPDGSVMIVSEHVEGRPLDRWADGVGIPPLPRVVALVHRICAGLHAAERAGVVHAALHPGNVLVAQRGDDPRPQIKIVDAGVPPFLRAWPPRPGLVPFLASEQVVAALSNPSSPPEPDPRSNVFACGCFLYALCTGGAPFKELELGNLAIAHAQGRVIAPSRINPMVPAALEAIILKALARLPEARFARSAELAQALAGLRLSSSGSGVRPRASGSIPAPVPAAADPRVTARAGFEERPTAESQLPPEWPEVERLSPLPEVPVHRAAPPLRSSAPPEPPREAPTVRPPPPPPPARSSAPPAAADSHPYALPLDPFAAPLVAPAPLARVEPASLAVPAWATGHPRARVRQLRAAALGATALLVAAGAYGLMGHPPDAGVEAVRIDPAPQAAAAHEGGARRAPAPVQAVRPPAQLERPNVDQLATIVRDPGGEQAPSARPLATDAIPRARRARVVAPSEPSAAPSPPSSAPVAPSPREVVMETTPPRAGSEAQPAIAAAPQPAPFVPVRLPLVPPRATRPAAPAPAAPAPARSAGAPAQLTVQWLDVRGSLATSEVRRGLGRVQPQMQACHASAVGHPSEVRGELQVEVDIDERGRARNPRVSGHAPAGLARCIEQAAAKLFVATPPDTGTVRASFGLRFAR